MSRKANNDDLYKSISDVGDRLVERLEVNGEIFQTFANSLRVARVNSSTKMPIHKRLTNTNNNKKQISKRWTEEQVDVLRRETANANSIHSDTPRPPNSRRMLDWKRLGIEFGRKPHSVYLKAWKMGLTRCSTTPTPTPPSPTVTPPIQSTISPHTGSLLLRNLNDEFSGHETSEAEWDDDDVFE